MRSKLALALLFGCWASIAFAQQPAFRTVQSSQDPTGPLGLLTNLNSGQEIDLINAPTTASQSFAFYQTITNNVRQLVFSFGPTNFTVPGLGGSGTQCLHVSNTGAITGTGADCAGASSGITQLTGDVTAGPGTGSQAATLATVNANVGSFGSATSCVAFTTNAKGLITAASATTCTPAIASVTGLGTSVAAVLAINVNTGGGITRLGAGAILQQSPADPTGTSSGTDVMMGLGTTCTLTPVQSTRVALNFQGQAQNAAAGGVASVQARFGTGTAPANAAAATGTTVGSKVHSLQSSANSAVMYRAGGVITGLTLGTAYWFDVAVSNISTGTTASVTNNSCDAHEIP